MATHKYKKGDRLVYPHHGACTVEKIEKMTAFDVKQDYLKLEVEEVFAVLRKKEARMPTNWSRRFKNHSEKLRSGDIYQVAEVVRNLSIRDKDKGLSAGEKRMLTRARQILVSELTFALNVDTDAAEEKLASVLP